MSTSRTLSKEAQEKIVERFLAQRERSRVRSAKLAQSKRDAGMVKVSFWVPKDEAADFRKAFAKAVSGAPDDRTGGAALQDHQEPHREHYGENHG
ncbi:hypothetical protein [Citrobacter sp. VF227]|jgi:hypothetical protein